MELPGSGQYADRANKVPMDGGASSSAAFGGFIRKLIMLAAGGAAGAAAGGTTAAGAGGGNALGGGLTAGAATNAPLAAAAGPSAGMWGEAAMGSVGGSAGPMVGLGSPSLIPGAMGEAAAAPTMGQSFMRGASNGGLRGGLQEMLGNYAQSQPAESVIGRFGTGAARSGNFMGGLQAQFMDPTGAPVVGNMNMFDLTNMGLQRLMQGRRRGWWGY